MSPWMQIDQVSAAQARAQIESEASTISSRATSVNLTKATLDKIQVGQTKLKRAVAARADCSASSSGSWIPTCLGSISSRVDCGGNRTQVSDGRRLVIRSSAELSCREGNGSRRCQLEREICVGHGVSPIYGEDNPNESTCRIH
jgi:hypothetical protein